MHAIIFLAPKDYLTVRVQVASWEWRWQRKPLRTPPLLLPLQKPPHLEPDSQMKQKLLRPALQNPQIPLL